MKITYVSGIWSGIHPLLFEGQEAESGMPAFVFPLKELVARGHEITLLFFAKGPLPDLKIGPAWLQQCQTIITVTDEKRSLQRKQAIGRTVKTHLQNNACDFLYLQGEKGSHLWRLGEAFNVPVGQRIYGVDNAARSLPKKHRLWARMKKPQLFASFTGRKAFVIVTRDGSQGHLLQKHLSPTPAYRFFHRLNGVEKPVRTPDIDGNTLSSVLDGSPYLFCPARFATMKAKERTLHFLKKMHDLGHNNLRLVVAGQRSKNSEFQLFQKEKEELGLQEFVDERGTLSRHEVQELARGSLAVLSFYRVSNLSNVSLEALSLGSLLITLDDQSLAGVCGSEDAIIKETPADAALALHKLLSDQQAGTLYARYRQQAYQKAD
jgi:glycosyltransferase involved in cell wall biosynthesis